MSTSAAARYASGPGVNRASPQNLGERSGAPACSRSTPPKLLTSPPPREPPRSCGDGEGDAVPSLPSPQAMKRLTAEAMKDLRPRRALDTPLPFSTAASLAGAGVAPAGASAAAAKEGGGGGAGLALNWVSWHRARRGAETGAPTYPQKEKGQEGTMHTSPRRRTTECLPGSSMAPALCMHPHASLD
jgi:hypothetical protein